MDDFPKWLLRIVGLIGAVAFITVYAMRHDFSQGWAPRFSEDYAPPPAAAPPPGAAPATAPASAEPPAPAAGATPAEAAKPAPAPAEVAKPAAAASVQPARAFVPCQPIGRTARGELVYSMDCRTPPQ